MNIDLVSLRKDNLYSKCQDLMFKDISVLGTYCTFDISHNYLNYVEQIYQGVRCFNFWITEINDEFYIDGFKELKPVSQVVKVITQYLQHDITDDFFLFMVNTTACCNEIKAFSLLRDLGIEFIKDPKAHVSDLKGRIWLLTYNRLSYINVVNTGRHAWVSDALHAIKHVDEEVGYPIKNLAHAYSLLCHYNPLLFNTKLVEFNPFKFTKNKGLFLVEHVEKYVETQIINELWNLS